MLSIKERFSHFQNDNFIVLNGRKKKDDINRITSGKPRRFANDDRMMVKTKIITALVDDKFLLKIKEYS